MRRLLYIMMCLTCSMLALALGLRQAINASDQTAEGTDLTHLIANASFDGSFDGWTKRGGGAVTGNLGTHNVEVYEQVVDVYQKIQGVPNGIYALSCQAFERPASNGNYDGSEVVKTHLFLNDMETPVAHIVTDAMPEANAENRKNCYIDDGSHSIGVWPLDYLMPSLGYVPNSIDGAYYAFSSGRYLQTVYGIVTNGKLEIGLTSHEKKAHWVLWAKFKLTYMGHNLALVSDVASNKSSQLSTYLSEHSAQMSSPAVAEAQAALDAAASASSADDKWEALTAILSQLDAVQENVMAVNVATAAVKAMHDAAKRYEDKASAEAKTAYQAIQNADCMQMTTAEIKAFTSKCNRVADLLKCSSVTVEYRYWFDNDESGMQNLTGIGMQNMDIDVSHLNDALHLLHVQVVDEEGLASAPHSVFFIKGHIPESGSLIYWFDENTAQTGMLNGGTSLIDVNHLPDGIHNLHVQKTGTVPSVVETAMFMKVSTKQDFADGFRYWFDHDDANQHTLKGMSVLTKVDINGLEDGLHMLHVQATGNSPSVTHSSFFLKTPQVLGVPTLTVVTAIDGKQCKQEEVPTSGGLLHYDFDATGLSEGVHLLTTQVVTESGVASSAKSSYFLRVSTAEEHSNMKCFYAIDGAEGFAQAGTLTNGTFHFDLDVAELSNGLHRLTYLMITEGGTASAMRTAFFMKTPIGGNGISSYHYWLNSDYAGRKQVRLDKNVSTLNLMSLLPVESVPLRSSQFHFEWTNGKPMVYAQNDFHIRFYDAADRCVDQCKDFTDYSVSQEIKDAKLLVSGTPVVKDKPAENEIQWYHFPAAVGDSLSFKVDRACTVQVFAPSGKEVYNASGSDVVKWDGCHAWEDGEYYLALHDVTAQQGTNTKLEFFQLGKYAVLTHSPEEIGAAPGYFHVTLFGNGYDKLKKAVLRMGDSQITADTCTVTDISNAMLEFYMPTDELPLGDYDLELYFNNEGKDENFVVPSAIRVAPPVYGDIEIAINSKKKVGKPYPVTINIKNTGNVEYQMVPLMIACDHPEKQIETYFMNFAIYGDSEDEAKNTPFFFETNNLLNKGIKGIMYPTLIPCLASKEEITLQVGFVTKPHDCFNLYAWTYKPWGLIGDFQAQTEYYKAKAKAKRKALPNVTCEADPCELAGGSECVCGVLWNNISAVANIYAALMNRAYQQRDEAFAADYEALGIESPYRRVRLRSPWAHIHNALSHCTGEIGDDKLEQLANVMLDGMGHLAGDDCPDPVPHPVNPYMPGDPNDMLGYITPESESKYIAKDVTDVYYNIEFENDPEIANAAAHHIVICDTLNSKLHDLSSFAPTSVKFGQYQMMLDGKEQSFVKTLDMRPAVNALAQIKLDYDAVKGIAKWDIQSLDPMTLEPTDDVMMGILPVNDDNGNGQGEVTFDIKLREGLADGTEIPNRASIVFDSEDAIMTPTWVNTLDHTAPYSWITGAEIEGDSITLHFDGADEGSGLWKYEVYEQTGNGAQWILAATVTDTTACRLRIYEGINHGYCVVATDAAGNVEVKELERELSTDNTLPGDANGDGEVDITDAVTIVNFVVTHNEGGIDMEAADMNGDGEVDITDAVMIVNQLIKKE